MIGQKRSVKRSNQMVGQNGRSVKGLWPVMTDRWPTVTIPRCATKNSWEF